MTGRYILLAAAACTCSALAAAKIDAAAQIGIIEARMRNDVLAAAARTKPETIQNWMAAMQPDGSFRDVDYQNRNRATWQTFHHLDRACLMAIAWAAPRHPLHRDPAVAQAVQSTMRWWIDHRPQNPNWWWNELSVPRRMGTAMLAAPELFPAGDLRDGGFRICRQSKNVNSYGGNNRVFCAVNLFRVGVLERNLPLMKEMAGIILEEVAIIPGHEEGVRPDGSFHQHGPQLQFGNYGGSFLLTIGQWANYWKDTEFALNDAQWAIMRDQTFNGSQWVLWNGYMDYLAIGRQFPDNAPAIKARGVLQAIRLLGRADPNGPEPYDAIATANRNRQNHLVGTRHFWKSDYMVHRRPGWFASVRMNSVRVRPIEDSINHDNPLGRYFSDGGIMVLLRGDEYNNLPPVWDWTRLPGTTLPATPELDAEACRKRKIKTSGEPARWSFGKRVRMRGETAFDGGVADAAHGVAVFDQNVDGVRAKKGYFLDAEAIYLLGTDIQSGSPYEVATTVNAPRRNGEVKQGPGWFWHDGIGYRGAGLKCRTELRHGDWGRVCGGITAPAPVGGEQISFFIPHGVQVKNGSYEAVIMPAVSPEATAKGPRGKILSNTAQLQAVEFADRTIGAIFYEPGKLGDFETDTPGLFLIGKNHVVAAEPTAERETMTIRGKTIRLPRGGDAGRSVAVEF